jgi:hypothetical protein
MCAEGVTNCWSQKSNGDQEGCWFEWWISKGPVTSSAEFSWPWTITGSSSRRTFASKQSSGMFLGLMSLLLANVQLSFVHYSLGFQTLGSWAHKRASFELSWRKVYQRWWGEKLKSKGWCIFLQRWILVHLFLGLAISCIGEKKGTNGCLDRWYNLLLWMMKTWITLWKRVGRKFNPTCHLSTYDGRCLHLKRKFWWLPERWGETL